MGLEVVSRWYATFLLEPDGTVRARYTVPGSATELAQRIAARRRGDLTPEEATLLAEHGSGELITGDRRLASHGIRLELRAVSPISDEPSSSTESGELRDAFLAEAERALRESWDPSVHVEEAVRSLRDLDRAINLLGERVGSWAARDRPELDPGDAPAAARAVLDAPDPVSETAPGADLANARRALARVYRDLEAARGDVDRAIRSTSPDRSPNLSALLGPELAAQMIATAGGLDRLSRLPSSTVQVLGAEKAFFEHLRGRAPPPRHGLLFLHPRIQSSGRAARGRLARALAGKVAIAARLDRAGRPVDPSLSAQFDARAKAIAAHPTQASARRRRSALPLDRAAADR